MWLIALALPIQGVAAATMLHCGATPAQQPASAHEGHSHHHQHGSHAYGGASAAAHDEGGHHHADPSPVDDAASAVSHHHAGGKSSCSACASCCSAAALPAMPIVLASQTPAEPVFAIPRLPVVVFLTDGPERPPRTILA